MDGDGIQEYVPIHGQDQVLTNTTSQESLEIESDSSLLTISDLVKKFSVSRPTIYSWIKKGLLKRIPIGGRVLFDPDDIRALIDRKKNS